MKKYNVLSVFFLLLMFFGSFSAENFVYGRESSDCNNVNKIEKASAGFSLSQTKSGQCRNAAESLQCFWDGNTCRSRLDQNVTDEQCANIPTGSCESYSGCKLSSNGEKCAKRGFLGIGAGDGLDRNALNEEHCKTYRADGAVWKNIFLVNGQLVTRSLVGKAAYDAAVDSLKNSCNSDARCNWNGLKSTGQSCVGRSGAKTEDKIRCDTAGKENCENTFGCMLEGDTCIVDESQFEFGDPDGFEQFEPYSGPVFGGPGLRAGARIAKVKLDNTISKERNLRNLILGWMRFAFPIVAAIAVVAIVYAGVLYVTDFGDGSRAEMAKKIVMYVAIGIILMLSAYAIVNTLLQARFGTDEKSGPVAAIAPIEKSSHFAQGFEGQGGKNLYLI